MKTAYSIILYFSLAISGLAAGWDPKPWSGDFVRYYLISTNEPVNVFTNKVSIKEALSSDAFAAIDERSEISGVAAATTNAWFRNNRADLVNIKAWIVANADKFWIPDQVTNDWLVTYSTQSVDYATASCTDIGSPNPDWEWDSWSTNSQSDVTITIPLGTYSTSVLIDTLSLSSNYFTSTPWRGLTSTNTANGWHAIDDILNLLSSPVVAVAYVNQSNGAAQPSGDIPEARQNSWVNAKADATNTLWNDSNPSVSGNQTIRIQKTSVGERVSGVNCAADCSFYCYLYNRNGNLSIILPSTNYTADVQWLAWFGEMQPPNEGTYRFSRGTTYPEGTGFYDAQGTSYTNAGLNFLSSTSDISGTVTNILIGDSVVSIPDMPDNPGNSGFNHENFYGAGCGAEGIPDPQSSVYTAKGWEIYATRAHADYINSSSPITYHAD